MRADKTLTDAEQRTRVFIIGKLEGSRSEPAFRACLKALSDKEVTP